MLIESLKTASPEDKAKLGKALGLEGKFNSAPWPLPNMKLSSEAEFWGWRKTYAFPIEAWCGQIRIDDQHATLMLYYVGHSSFIDGGFAVAYFYKYPGPSEVRYYTFGACDHEFTHKRTGNCQHEYTCKKCGKSYDVDSS